MVGTSSKTAGSSPASAARTKPMSATAEAHGLISQIAFGLPPQASIQEMLALVARRTGLGARRLRGIWNNEARAIKAEELDALREAAACRREEQDRHEYRSLADRLAFLEDRMAQIDPSFRSSSVPAVVAPKSNSGRAARPLVGGR